VRRECSTHEDDPETRVSKRRKPLAGRLLVDDAGRLTVNMQVAAAGMVGSPWYVRGYMLGATIVPLRVLRSRRVVAVCFGLLEFWEARGNAICRTG